MTTRADTFNRADQSGLGTSSDGWAWEIFIDSGAEEFSILSNAGRLTAVMGATRAARCPLDLASSNAEVQVTLAHVGFTAAVSLQFGVLGRQDGSASETYYLARYRADPPGPAYQLVKLVAGALTQLGAVSQTAVDGDILALRMDGTAISLKLNGATLIGPVTDSAITTGLRAGVRGVGQAFDTVDFDGWQAQDIAVAAASESTLLYV